MKLLMSCVVVCCAVACAQVGDPVSPTVISGDFAHLQSVNDDNPKVIVSEGTDQGSIRVQQEHNLGSRGRAILMLEFKQGKPSDLGIGVHQFALETDLANPTEVIASVCVKTETEYTFDQQAADTSITVGENDDEVKHFAVNTGLVFEGERQETFTEFDL